MARKRILESQNKMIKKQFIYVRIGPDGSVLEVREVSRGHPPSGFIKINRDKLDCPGFGIKKPKVQDPNLITLKDIQTYLMPVIRDKIVNKLILVECDILKKNNKIDDKIGHFKVLSKVEICLLSGDVSVWRSKTSKQPDIVIPAMIAI